MKRYVPWVGAFAILFLVFGSVYGAVQQAQRSAANMPQIQLAEDAAADLNKHALPVAVTPGHVEMSQSLAPFVIVYNRQGAVVSGSGYLYGKIPRAPLGILTASTGTDFHTVTWQPAANVRIAAVTVTSDKYYVLSGRSLKEVESNESKTFLITATGFLFATVILISTASFKRW